MRSRLEPIKSIARMLRSHRELILNWFRAKKEFSSGSVEALNSHVKLVTKRARGFRTFEAVNFQKHPQILRMNESFSRQTSRQARASSSNFRPPKIDMIIGVTTQEMLGSY